MGAYFIMETAYTFLGYINSKIVYSEKNKQWELISTIDNKTKAFLNTSLNKPPIGLHKWYFNLSCHDHGKAYRTLHLHLEVKQPENFCCFDGSCINSDFVCDGTADCQGMEDERDCKDVILPQYYDNSKPPAKVVYNNMGKVF